MTRMLDCFTCSFITATCDAPWYTEGVVLEPNETLYMQDRKLYFECEVGAVHDSGDTQRTCLSTRDLSGFPLVCIRKIEYITK